MERKEFVSGQVAKVQTAFTEMLGSALDEAVQFGISSVVLPEPTPILGSDASEQEKIDAAVAQVRAEMEAKDAETPITQAELDEAKGLLAVALEENAKLKSDDEADKASIEAARAKIEAALAALQG